MNFWTGVQAFLLTAGLALSHEGYHIENLRPEGFEPRISGMRFLPDGRLAVTVFSHDTQEQIDNFVSHKNGLPGKILMLDGVTEGGTENVTHQVYADNLVEPLGIEMLNGDIYVMEHDALVKFTDSDNDGMADSRDTLFGGWLLNPDQRVWSHGPYYRDGHFYVVISSAIHSQINDPDIPDLLRGVVLAIPESGGEYEILSNGIRSPDGIAPGPGGSILVSDNQGIWTPSSKIIQVQRDKFFGYRWGSGDTSLPISQPALWLPHGDLSASPSLPIVARDGPYQGQILVGDVTRGKIMRGNLELVNGLYQGAAFDFIVEGFDAGIQCMQYGPDGILYAAGIGNGGNTGWGWGATTSALHRITPTNQIQFDILSMHSRSRGIEVRFTDVIDESTLSLGQFSGEQWHYEGTENYGGPKIDLEDLNLVSFSVSPERKALFLEVDNMKPDKVLRINVGDVVSATGKALYQNSGYYTLNSISSTQPFSVIGCMDSNYVEYNSDAVLDNGSCHTLAGKEIKDKTNSKYFALQGLEKNRTLSILERGKHRLDFYTVSGELLNSIEGNEPTHYHLHKFWANNLLLVKITVAGRAETFKLVP